MLDISRATLYRRLEEAANNSITLSDAQLDEIILSIKQDHPNDGEVYMPPKQ